MDKFLSLLGLAMKAGRVIYGADMVQAGAGKVRLLIVASDAGNSAVRNAGHLAQKHGFASVSVPFGKAELGYSIGKKPCALIAVTDKGIAEGLLRLL